MTNFEYIKAMSVKRMAQFMVTQFMVAEMSEFPCAFCECDNLICDGKCENKTDEYIIEEWLKREKEKCI